MTKLFDTHAHYFADRFNELDGGADAILSSEEFREAVGKVICVGSDPSNVHISTDLARKYDFMYAAVGIHPEDAQSMCKKTPDEEIYDCVESLVFDERERKENKIVAIGEIGFDYFCKPTDKPLQYEYFYKQMELARRYSLPVIVHNRNAHGDTLDMLRRFPDVTGVLHSCSMSAETVKEIVKLGWYVSFSGSVTFENAERVRAACRAVPLDRLLIETDAPYLAPVPYRGKVNHSIFMKEICAAVAECHGITSDEMADMTYANACKLFNVQ
ncbi:MAG: TatD family deoxyribonuclease [Ruminococcaceae bacterium]|nr:TatD family deoxyribonuclease [Oscillospiraceae bacterium]MBO5041226.1 TatD family hydrolase [Clostridia bacterium]